MPDFDSKKQKVRRELERMGYRNIPDTQLNEFTTDLQRLMCHDRASRGSRSQARSATSPSSRGERDSSFRDSSERCGGGGGGGGGGRDHGISARSSQYYRPSAEKEGRCSRPCSPGSGLTSSYRASPDPCSSSSAPRRKAFRCERGRRREVDDTSLYSDTFPAGSEFHNLHPEMASDGTPEYDDDDCEEVSDDCAPCEPAGCGARQRAICAKPFPKLRVSPVVPPELLPPRSLARPGFRVMAEMLAHPIRSDPCTRMKWYSDYWATLKIPGIYRHHALQSAIRNMLDTYDYMPRPLNRREPVWNMSLLREQPTAMMKLNWC